MNKYLKEITDKLLEGGKITTCELFISDYNTLSNQPGWEPLSNNSFLSELYYDTKDNRINSLSCCLKLNELSDSDCFLSFELNGGRRFSQVINSGVNDVDLKKEIEPITANILSDLTGVDIQNISSKFRTSVKPLVRRIDKGFLVLSFEIIYGSHQASISCIGGKEVDRWEIIKNVLRNNNITIKSKKTRYQRLNTLRLVKENEGTPEQNRILHKYLSVLAKGYSTGNFEKLFGYLSRSCVFESQWRLDSENGYDKVRKYFIGKGKALRENKSFPKGTIVELKGNSHPVNSEELFVNGERQKGSAGIYYTAGKLCLYCEQIIDGEKSGIMVDISIDDRDLITRIDVCLPELFRFRSYDVLEEKEKS